MTVDRRCTVRLVVVLALVLEVAIGSVPVAPASNPPLLPPLLPQPPSVPKGPPTRCRVTGPGWAIWGVHTPNGPPRRGNQYLVNAWGIPCSKARTLVLAFFPTIPAHAMGKLAGGPKGFICKGLASGLTKNRMYTGTCLRFAPAAEFDWSPVGRKRGIAISAVDAR